MAMTTNSFPAAPICHEQNVCVPCAMGVAEESNIEVSRKKHGQEEANKSEIKDSEQWRCSFEVLHVSDDSGDHNCRKGESRRTGTSSRMRHEIGRASCRERV